MKRKTFQIGVAALLCMVVLTGCTWFGGGDGSDSTVGRLRINILGGGGPRAIEPPVVLTVNDYEVILTSPGNVETRRVVTVDESTTTFNDLELGEWTVRVDARDSAATPATIATEETTVTIESGRTATVSMTVVPVDGAGTLTLTLEWPDELLTTPGVVATLTPLGSETGQDISGDFTVDTSGAPHTATYSVDWPAGYYVLEIGLTEDGAVVWGEEVVSVRIIEGEVSVGTYTLSDTEFTVSGSLQVNIGADLQNPYAVTLSGQQDVIAPTDTMTVTASLDPAETPESYEWYLDGDLQADYTGSSITIGDTGVAVADGAYRLSVLVIDTNTLSSESTGFRVDSTGP